MLPPPGSPARGGAGPSGWRGPALALRAVPARACSPISVPAPSPSSSPPSFLLPRYPLPRPRASGSAPGSLGSAPLSRRPGPASRSRSLPARWRLIVGGGQITPPGGGAGGQRRGRGLSRSPAPPARLPSALTAALPPCSAAAAHGARRPGPWPPRAAAALPAALRVLFLYRSHGDRSEGDSA